MAGGKDERIEMATDADLERLKKIYDDSAKEIITLLATVGIEDFASTQEKRQARRERKLNLTKQYKSAMSKLTETLRANPKVSKDSLIDQITKFNYLFLTQNPLAQSNNIAKIYLQNYQLPKEGLTVEAFLASQKESNVQLNDVQRKKHVAFIEEFDKILANRDTKVSDYLAVRDNGMEIPESKLTHEQLEQLTFKKSASPDKPVAADPTARSLHSAYAKNRRQEKPNITVTPEIGALSDIYYSFALNVLLAVTNNPKKYIEPYKESIKAVITELQIKGGADELSLKDLAESFTKCFKDNFAIIGESYNLDIVLKPLNEEVNRYIKSKNIEEFTETLKTVFVPLEEDWEFVHPDPAKQNCQKDINALCEGFKAVPVENINNETIESFKISLISLVDTRLAEESEETREQATQHIEAACNRLCEDLGIKATPSSDPDTRPGPGRTRG